MVLLNEPKEVPLGVDDLPGEVALAEDGVAGDHAPLQVHPVEEPEGRLVLVGLVLGALGHGRLSEREARFVGHQGEQMHGPLQAVEAAPGRFAVEGERLPGRGLGRDRSAQVRLGPPGQRGLEGVHVQGDQDLADPPRFHGQAREAESVHQREVLVLAPLADRRIALRAGQDRTAHQGEDG